MTMIQWYPLYLVPAGIAWLAVWSIAGQKSGIYPGDRGLLFAPWVVFYATSLVFPGEKNLANLIEIVALAACVPAAFVLRLSLSRRYDPATLSARILWGTCAIGVVLWLAVPAQPLP